MIFHFSKTHLVIEIGPRTIIKIVLVLLIEFVVWTILCVVYLCYKEEYAVDICLILIVFAHFKVLANNRPTHSRS